MNQLFWKRIIHLRTQAADGDFKNVEVAVEVHVPDLFGNDGPGQWLALAAHQQLEQGKLFGGQIKAHAGARRSAPDQIELQVSDMDRHYYATHALTMALRHPDVFTSCITMGGAYDVTRFLDGYNDTDVYLLCPPQFLPGLADHAWFTGSAAWLFWGVTELMLGLRRGYDGIRVHPCMPAAWREARFTRRYRGTTYHLQIVNSGGREGAPLARLSVDDQLHDPSLPLPLDGGEHQILAELAE